MNEHESPTSDRAETDAAGLDALWGEWLDLTREAQHGTTERRREVMKEIMEFGLDRNSHYEFER